MATRNKTRSRPKDAIAMLQADHHTVRQLFRAYRTAQDHTTQWEMQPERDFNQQGEETTPSRMAGRPGRTAKKWFSFDLPVDTAHPMTLIVTYHNEERANRTFDILVDGVRVGRMRGDDEMAHADELVPQAKVGQEDDRPGHLVPSWGRPAAGWPSPGCAVG